MTTMTKYLLPLALLIGACDSDQPAVAPEKADAVEGAEAHGRGKFAKLDVDGDGAISLAEARGHRIEGKFAELDADKDGKLTHDELAAMKRGKGRDGSHGKGKDPAARADHLLARLDADKDGSISKAESDGHKFADRFAAADANTDGKITRDELLAMKLEHGGFHGKGHGKGGWHKDPAERADHLLGKFDADKDGSISRAELDGHRFADKLAAVDSNTDGKLTRDELLAMKLERGEGGGRHRDPAERADHLLGKLDADKDGSISKAEIAGHRFAEKFTAADGNGDGKVTRDELVAYKTARAAEHGEGKHGEGKHGEGKRGDHGRHGPR